METGVFYLVALGVLVSALGVVTARSPLRGALSLVVCLCGLAVLFVLLEASFLAAMQVMVYAGAIMVLFVFVIMLLNLGTDGTRRPAFWSLSKGLGVLAVLYVGWRALQGVGSMGPSFDGLDGTVRGVGLLLLTDHVFAFEAVSMLLLAAVVGSVVLAQKRVS
jgi:NADH-quinone oxidoreductase subunit J